MKTKTAVKIGAGALAAAATAGAVAGLYAFNLALNPKTKKDKIFSASHNKSHEPEQWGEEREDMLPWMADMEFRQRYILSYDSIKLQAYTIINPGSHKWIILAHGYMGNAEHMLWHGRHFYDMGYNLLIPDARGHGKSGGNVIGMGWLERLDLQDWIYEIMDTDEDAQIALFGVSMGGAAVIATSGDPLPSCVKAVIEDSGYSSVKGQMKYQMKMTMGVPSFPILNLVSMIAKLKGGYFLEEGDIKKQATKSQIPTLFIHGSKDTFVRPEMMDELYNAAGCEKEKLLIDGAGHVGGAHWNGELYWGTVRRFLDKYITDGSV